MFFVRHGKLHMSSEERVRGGEMRQYMFLGLDCAIDTGTGGVDVKGNGLKFYFTTDGGEFAGIPDARHVRTSTPRPRLTGVVSVGPFFILSVYLSVFSFIIISPYC